VDLLIATLIAAESLDWEKVGDAADALDAEGFQMSAPWLERGSAMDFRFHLFGPAAPAEIRRARNALQGCIPGLDAVVQDDENRAKRLLVADMDSTMITVECIDELADYAGLKAEVAAITERAMQGELDFKAALDARVALLAGLEEALLDRCREERVRLTPGAKTLVQTMKARGATTILVSGGFTRFADAVGQQLGFDRVVANRLEASGGKLTGRVLRPIVDAETKRQVLLDACAELGIPVEASLAVGDGANDIPMLQAAGLGIAYHAKPAARAAADAAIDHNDLTALLYAQGIPKAEWVD
jgi:phosphoserine phosphatase